MTKGSEPGAHTGRSRDNRLFRPGEAPPLFGDTAATLIVDDDEQLAEVLNRLLSREGYRCTVATSAHEARARLAERDFALALVDVMMPDESGLELAAEMLAHHPDLAVVMVTGIDDPRIAELAFETGAYGYVIKPFQSNQVLVTVANASQRRCLEIERNLYEKRLELQMGEQAADLDAALVELKDARRHLLVSPAERDVTEPIEARAEREPLKAQAQRERLERQLHQSQRLESLGQLAGGVAHDFNNLLGAIINYAAFVGEEIAAAATSESVRDWTLVQRDVSQIQRAADRAAQLTHQLLAFARREVVRPQVLVVNDVVSEVEQLLRRTIGEHIELVISLAPDLCPVLADRVQIEQVLVNLAVNARDAMPGGGTLTIVTDNVAVDEAYAASTPGLRPGRYARLRASDTGTGMRSDVVQRAFEPFFTTKPKGEGSGLGLATVYGILTQSGGVARIYSEPGMGTTFTALLPATEQPIRAHLPGEDNGTTGAGEAVLVVEDEDGMREVTERILSRNGYRVLTAHSGPAAIEVAGGHEGRIDLLVTDVVMPQMLGTEVAARIASFCPGIRVLYMSGYAQPVLGAQGTLEEGVTLVEKPFSEAALLARVREVLDRPDSRSQSAAPPS